MRSATTHPQIVHNSIDALFSAMGAPVRSALKIEDDGRIDNDQVFHAHPAFALAVHSEGADAYLGTAYSSQNTHRGDILSVPCTTEAGTVVLLETSFHKGDVYVELVEFPDCNDDVQRALHTMLQSVATR